MTTATLTISEFLLARVVEEETLLAQAASIVEPDDDHLTTWHDGGEKFTNYYLVANHRRMVAECATKRAIVDMQGTSWSPEGCWLEAEVLGLMAAVYADHADYRDEWRV